jgi:hypothetical protein
MATSWEKLKNIDVTVQMKAEKRRWGVGGEPCGSQDKEEASVPHK